MDFISLKWKMASRTLPGGTRALAGPYQAERGSLAREAWETLGSNILICIYIYIYLSLSLLLFLLLVIYLYAEVQGARTCSRCSNKRSWSGCSKFQVILYSAIVHISDSRTRGICLSCLNTWNTRVILLCSKVGTCSNTMEKNKRRRN